VSVCLTSGGCILAGTCRDLPHWSALQSRGSGIRQEVGELLQEVIVVLEQVGNLSRVPSQESPILRISRPIHDSQLFNSSSKVQIFRVFERQLTNHSNTELVSELGTKSSEVTNLFVDVGDGLLPLPVHVEDLQEGLVDPLVVGEPSLRGQACMSASGAFSPERLRRRTLLELIATPRRNETGYVKDA